MKKVLVTGGSHAELPLIDELHKLGYTVITTGNNKEGIGHQHADQYISGDFSDINFVYELAEKEQVCGIVSGCNDFAYLSTAYACEKLGLPGHDSYEMSKKIHHKEQFHQLLGEAGIRVPRHIDCSKEEVLEKYQQIGFPLVVKPVDLTGGKGVHICYDSSELMPAVEHAFKVSRKKIIMLEEYIEGGNYGGSFLIKNGRVTTYFCGNEQYSNDRYLVSGAYGPSDLSQQTLYELLKQVEKLAQKNALVDGLFHVQFIVDKSGYPIMIDPCRRTPGDLYVLLAGYSSGVNFAGEIVKAELGLEIADTYCEQHHFVARECIMADCSGTIKEIRYNEEIENKILYQMVWGKSGDYVEDYLKYKAGIVIMRFDHASEMIDVGEHFKEKVTLCIEKGV